MKINVTELEYCRYSVSAEADAKEISEKEKFVLQAFKKAPLVKKSNIKGFRKGKGSLEAIKHQYKAQIEESLKRALAEDAYHNTLFEHKFRPHGGPRFSSFAFIDNKFACSFELNTKPDFELAPYKNMEIPKPHELVSPLEFAESMMQDLRSKCGNVEVFSDSDLVTKGDNVIINYEGFMDGNKNDNLSADGEMLTVGKSQLFSFDENLLGMRVDEVKEFDIISPKDGLPSLSDKTIHFKVMLTTASKTEPHPLDDSLAVKVGKKDFNELRTFVNSIAMARTSAAARTTITNVVSAKLVSDNSFVVPNWLALSEAQYLASSAKMVWETMPEIDKEKYLDVASKNVKLALILDKIREVEPEAQLTDQEVLSIIRQNLEKANSSTPVNDEIKNMQQTGYLQLLFSRIKDEHCLNFVVKSVKVIE